MQQRQASAHTHHFQARYCSSIPLPKGPQCSWKTSGEYIQSGKNKTTVNVTALAVKSDQPALSSWTGTCFRGPWLTGLVVHEERGISLQNTFVRLHRGNLSRTAPLFTHRNRDEPLSMTTVHLHAAATQLSCVLITVKNSPGNFISGTKIAIVSKALRDLTRALRVCEQCLCQANFLRQRVKKVRFSPITFSISFFLLSSPD